MNKTNRGIKISFISIVLASGIVAGTTYHMSKIMKNQDIEIKQLEENITNLEKQQKQLQIKINQAEQEIKNQLDEMKPRLPKPNMPSSKHEKTKTR